MEIKKVCVIGAGRMGRQIGLCAAIHGYDVTLFDAKAAILEDVEKWKEEYLAGRVAKGRMTGEQVAGIKGRFHTVPELAAACAGVQLVIEAIFESEPAKFELFRQIQPYISEDTIVATNSSFMVSSKFKDAVKNPSRLCNMHFYNPALVLKFVEIVQGPHTSEETGKLAYDFCVSIGKTPILQKKELDGFAGNYILKNLTCPKDFYEQNYGRFQETDIMQEHMLQRKMGTFRLVDLTGIDLSYTMLSATLARTGKKPVLYDVFKILHDIGRFGQTTGHGFYDYKEPFTVQTFRDRSVKSPNAKQIASVLVVGGENARRIADEMKTAGVNAACAPWTGDASKLPKADFVLEDIGGGAEEKRAFWRAVCAAMPEDTILASNDYEIMSSQVADAVKDPARFMSAHFSPAGDGTVVEIVVNDKTDKDAAGAVYDLCLAMKKNPIWQQKEIPEYGYHSKQFMGYLGKACKFLVDEGYCTEDDIDVCMENGIGFAKGYYKMIKLAF